MPPSRACDELMPPGIEIGLRVPACAPASELGAFIARAEDAGFAFVAMPDTQVIARDPFVTLALAAQRTTRIALQVAVTNPVTRHVSVLACLARSVAEVAPGRFSIVLGRGDSAVKTVGLSGASLGELRDAIDHLKGLVGGESVTLQGRRVRMGFGDLGVPIHVAATGPKTIALAGEIGDGALIQVANVPGARTKAWAHFRAGAQIAGRDPMALAVTWGVVPTIVTQDMPAAWREAHAYCASWALMPERAQWLRNAGVSLPEFAMPPELANVYPDIAHAERPEEVRRLTPFLTDEIVAQICDTMGMFGTPDYCATRFAALAREGVRRICVRSLATYSLPETLLEAFGSEVFPRLRRLLRG